MVKYINLQIQAAQWSPGNDTQNVWVGGEEKYQVCVGGGGGGGRGTVFNKW